MRIFFIIFMFQLVCKVDCQESPELIPFRLRDKWGYCDKQKNLIVSPKYDETYPFTGSYGLVRMGERYGLINSEGKEILKPKYSRIEKCTDSLIIGKKGKKVTIANEEGKRLIVLRNIFYVECLKNKILVKKNSLAIYIGSNILKFKIKIDEGKKFFMTYDKKKTHIPKGIYIESSSFDNDSLFIISDVYNFNRNNLMDLEGNIRFKNYYLRLTFLERHSKFLLAAKKIGEVGVIDLNENIIVPFENSNVWFYDNFFITYKEGKAGVYDLKGKKLIDNKYSSLLRYIANNDTFLIAQLENSTGLINLNDEVIIPFEQKKLCYVTNKPGVFLRYDPKTFCIEVLQINAKSKLYEIDTIYCVTGHLPYINLFHVDTILKINKNKKQGLINFRGQQLIAPIYDEIADIKDQKVKVRIKNKYGLVNLKGEVLMYPEYDEIEVCNDSIIIFRKGIEYGLINLKKSQKIIEGCEYIICFDQNYLIKKNGKYGVITADGKYKIPVKYDAMKRSVNDLWYVKYKGKKGYVDNEGNEYWVD